MLRSCNSCNVLFFFLLECCVLVFFFFFSSRRRHTRLTCDWSSDVCSSDLDGPLPLGPPKGTFIGVPDDEVKKMLTDNFLSADNVVLEQNSPIVNTGDKLVLFDTGMGTLKLFGPTTGRQQKSMKEAGIKPEDIDAVVFSHAHIDHIGGVVDESGKVLFPNAQYYMAQSDFDFWTDESKAGGPLKDFIVHARKNLLPIRDRIVF